MTSKAYGFYFVICTCAEWKLLNSQWLNYLTSSKTEILPFGALSKLSQSSHLVAWAHAFKTLHFHNILSLIPASLFFFAIYLCSRPPKKSRQKPQHGEQMCCPFMPGDRPGSISFSWQFRPETDLASKHSAPGRFSNQEPSLCLFSPFFSWQLRQRQERAIFLEAR